MPLAFHFPSILPNFTDQPTSSRVLSRNVRNFMDKELKIDIRGQHFLLAVSGGVDSLALLCLWLWLRPIYGHTLSVCHIDHMLREESPLEAKTIANLCAAWGIEYFVHQTNIPKLAHEQKKGLEEMARIERYIHLENYRKKCQAHWICLGHHLGDLQEDILMRLMRGSGWPALGGMQALDKKRNILRPLLLQEQNQLTNLVKAAGIGHADDKSNCDTKYLRNRVRHNILPLIHAENPSFQQKAAELWQFASYDQEHWQDIVLKLFAQVKVDENAITLPAAMLNGLDKATRLRLYMHSISTLAKGQARANTLIELDNAWVQGRGNTTFQLPGNVEARLKKGAITFQVIV